LDLKDFANEKINKFQIRFSKYLICNCSSDASCFINLTCNLWKDILGMNIIFTQSFCLIWGLNNEIKMNIKMQNSIIFIDFFFLQWFSLDLILHTNHFKFFWVHLQVNCEENSIKLYFIIYAKTRDTKIFPNSLTIDFKEYTF
jgi:hypothetical protein